MINKERDNR